jgi:hypothetical protein
MLRWYCGTVCKFVDAIPKGATVSRRGHCSLWVSGLLAVSMGLAQPPDQPRPPGPVILEAPSPTKPGQILPGPVQDQLKLTSEQKKQVEELQKEVDEKLAKILTPQQRKLLDDMAKAPPVLVSPLGPGGPIPIEFGRIAPGNPGRNSVEEVKKQINASDEEWLVIRQKLQKVINARQVEATDGSMGGPERAAFAPSGTNVITDAIAEFKAVLDDPKHTKEDIKKQIAAVRKAREKAHADFEAAQKSLADLLTKEQQEILAGLGYLDSATD